MRACKTSLQRCQLPSDHFQHPLTRLHKIRKYTYQQILNGYWPTRSNWPILKIRFCKLSVSPKVFNTCVKNKKFATKYANEAR